MGVSETTKRKFECRENVQGFEFATEKIEGLMIRDRNVLKGEKF